MAYLRPEYGIRKLLRESAAVIAASNADITVCPVDDVPRNVSMPFITYLRISGEPAHHLGGVDAGGFWQGRTEFVAYAETKAQADTLANAMRTTLDGAEPVTVTISADSVVFQRLHLVSEDDETFNPSDASDSRVHTVTQEYEWSTKA
jgi:hypothetical protein